MKVFKISELAEKVGVSRRTIHYYLARRLLPPPEGSGLATLYNEEHYYRVILIKKWQSSFLPLEEIRSRIANLNLAEIKKAIKENKQPIPQPTSLSTKSIGKLYERVHLDKDLEIHFYTANQHAKEQAQEIITWFNKQKKEG